MGKPSLYLSRGHAVIRTPLDFSSPLEAFTLTLLGSLNSRMSTLVPHHLRQAGVVSIHLSSTPTPTPGPRKPHTIKWHSWFLAHLDSATVIKCQLVMGCVAIILGDSLALHHHRSVFFTDSSFQVGLASYLFCLPPNTGSIDFSNKFIPKYCHIILRFMETQQLEYAQNFCLVLFYFVALFLFFPQSLVSITFLLEATVLFLPFYFFGVFIHSNSGNSHHLITHWVADLSRGSEPFRPAPRCFMQSAWVVPSPRTGR